MTYSTFEVAAVIVTLVSGAVNVAQWVIARNARLLHAVDMDGLYTSAFRGVEEIDHAFAAINSGDLSTGRERIRAAKGRFNSIRELCQNRLQHLERRKPTLRPPWDAERIAP